MGSSEDYFARLPRFRYRVIWVGVAGSFLGMAIIAASAVALGEGLGPLGLSVFVFLGASLSGGLYLEARRDSYAFCRSLSALAIGIISLAGFAFAVWREGRQFSLAVGLVGVAALLGCAFYLRRLRRARQSQNMLRERFPDSSIRERDGVQFMVDVPQRCTAREPFEIHLYAQNCTDAPRRLEVELRPSKWLALSKAKLEVGQGSAIELPPLAYGHLAIPAVILSDGKGELHGTAIPTITGRPGRRMLMWSPKRRAGGVLTLGLTAFGILPHDDEAQLRTFYEAPALEAGESLEP